VEGIQKLVPDYMLMGERGMADMGEMEMPLPDNTLPMMTGQGPFGAVEMGGMFTVLKVRREQKPGDYSDPGWFRHPPDTVAHEWTGAPLAEAPRSRSAGGRAMRRVQDAPTVEMQVRKPAGHEGR
ncbi:MAG: copper oxidase, partial [Proteobacteria bacterium]|nr:copper oxidase [Pseudomonadota bacterium]